MTLTNRLSLFFLTTLALVLAGFSSVLYYLASVHLHQQAEERLEAALNMLAAAVEVGPDAVEWEPAERQLSFGSGAFGDQVVWLVSDEQGRRVDRGVPPALEDLLAEAAQDLRASERATERIDRQGESWQFRQLRLAPALRDAASPPVPNKDERKFRALSITAGMPFEPMQSTLRQLASMLIGLSLTVWLLALFAGRSVCRRALLPVRNMAASARDMDANDLGRRLPGIRTGDELEDLSRAFNNLLDRLQESLERQRRFTGEASHQLRTPLAAILGQIEVVLRRERSADEYQQVLTTVHQKAEHMRRMVESLLFLARADAEARFPDRERINLKEWLPAHLRSWADHPRASDLIADTAGVDVAWVEAQPVVLGELVNILLDNACKYSPAGTPVTIQLGQVGPAVELSVRDQGCGIPQDDQRHLFTSFYRSADTRRRGISGLGLGLAIAKRLAGACDGTLSLTSQEGHGSCFTLRLAAS